MAILVFSLMLILVLGFWIATLVARWRVYVKAGRAGWESLIPIYSSWVDFQIVYGNGWKFLLLLIPIVNIIVGIKFCLDMAECFGQSAAFGLGLLFLSPIFMMILGFDSTIEYDGVLDDVRTAVKTDTVISDEELENLRAEAVAKLKAKREARQAEQNNNQ